MKIEIWSDYACPFCYIGKHRLEQALEKFPHREQVTIEFKSFQLDPDAPLYNGEKYYESLAQKFGSMEQAQQMTENVKNFAKSVNLELNFEDVKPTNTYNAHRLAKLALNDNKNNSLAEGLFEAHFTKAKDIGDFDTLIKIATEVGLERDQVSSMLHDEATLKNEVQHDLDEASQFNITGVPFFVFNRKLAVSGAQEVETFEQALQEVWEDRDK